MSSDPAQRLNNQFQQTLIGGLAVATNDAVSLNDEDRRTLSIGVRLFDTFTSDNDPYGEHDFDSIDIDGSCFFWKIDCFDQAMSFGTSQYHNRMPPQRAITAICAI